MQIRPEEPGDHRAIRTVVGDAFKSDAEPRLVELIRASPEYRPELALVAEVEGSVAGHVMISDCEIVDGDVSRQACTLSPLAVAPDQQGRGVGSALVRAVVGRADDLGVPFVVLEGDPRYYSRFGFEHAVLHGITIHLPAWSPPEAAQVIRLRTYDPSVRGTIVYPPAFAEVEAR